MDNLMNKFDFAQASSMAVAIAKSCPVYALCRFGNNVVSWTFKQQQPAIPVPTSAWEDFLEWAQQPTVISCLTTYLLGVFLFLGSFHYGYLLWSAYGTILNEQVSLACGMIKAGFEAMKIMSSNTAKSLQERLQRKTANVETSKILQDDLNTATADSVAIRGDDEWISVSKRSGFMTAFRK